MEITWFGGSCVRLKGREGVVVADPFRSIVGPTGRGLTADIVSFGYPEDAEAQPRGSKGKADLTSRLLGVPVPTSLASAYVLDSPGEFEVHDVMIIGVRTFRDAERGRSRGLSTAFVYELDGVYAAHLGNVGHLLDQDTIREIGHVDIVCLGIGPQLSAAQAAEIVTQLDATLVVPMPLTEAAAAPDADLARFLKEMSVTDPQPAPKVNVTISSVPTETTVVLLEQRGRV
ncbi:MAG TPA: MBL fold metallo-hydrolase [Candidatus Limnocylindrales bacterium]|nr:MBL fold metallo-hydrolase [Candidatus Limnocylindrales bacterium]